MPCTYSSAYIFLEGMFNLSLNFDVNNFCSVTFVTGRGRGERLRYLSEQKI